MYSCVPQGPPRSVVRRSEAMGSTAKGSGEADDSEDEEDEIETDG